MELGSIDFTSANKSMEKFHKGPCECDSLEKSVHIVQLFEICSTSEKVSTLFSIEDQPYCKLFSESAAHLPLALQSLFDPAHLEHSYVKLVEAGENMHRILYVTPLQQSHLEKLTHGQARSVMDEALQWAGYNISFISSHIY